MAVVDETDQRNVRRPFEPTGDPRVDNALHSVKADIADLNDDLVERIGDLEDHMNERFDAVDGRFDRMDSDLQAIKDHLGIDDGS